MCISMMTCICIPRMTCRVHAFRIKLVFMVILAFLQELRKAMYCGCGYIPDVLSMQAWLECAWEAGFDTEGREQLGHHIQVRRRLRPLKPIQILSFILAEDLDDTPALEVFMLDMLALLLEGQGTKGAEQLWQTTWRLPKISTCVEAWTLNVLRIWMISPRCEKAGSLPLCVSATYVGGAV